MRRERITLSLDRTQEITSLPKEVIADVINYQFSSLFSYIRKPSSYAGIRFPLLGVFRPKSARSIREYLLTLIQNQKESPSPEGLTDIRNYYRLYRNVQKDEQRRKYKKRFGTWHWKKT